MDRIEKLEQRIKILEDKVFNLSKGNIQRKTKGSPYDLMYVNKRMNIYLRK